MHMTTEQAEEHFKAGLDFHTRGALQEAADAYQKAIFFDPEHAGSHNHLAVLLRKEGQERKARILGIKAILFKPDYQSAYYNLGVAFYATGEISNAVTCYEKSIKLAPFSAESYNNLGICLQQAGFLTEARQAHIGAILCVPSSAESNFNLGNILKILRKDDAATFFVRVIRLNPLLVPAHIQLGIIMEGRGEIEKSTVLYRTAVQIQPEMPEAHLYLGNNFRLSGKFEDAEKHLFRAIILEPASYQAINVMGIICQTNGMTEYSMKLYDRAIRLYPEYSDTYNNLGTALQIRGEFGEAEQAFRAAIKFNSESADGHSNLGMILLSKGNFEEGWAEYEWRWQTKDLCLDVRNFDQPLWKGEVGKGRTLLIYAEQGFGDSLQFCRYATLAAAKGWRILLEAPPSLVRIMESLINVDQIIPHGTTLPAFDAWCPMLSLPLALGTKLTNIPAKIPYLFPKTSDIERWDQRLGKQFDDKPRIGLAWAGNPRAAISPKGATDRRRSIAPELLAPLFTSRLFHFFSLQKSGPPAPSEFQLIDFMPEMHDFADSAAFIANLDLIISVDTSIVHLAGAIGKPIWLLDRFDHCWRWLQGRSDSPWYPTMQIFRQENPGDWSVVIAKMAVTLESMVS